MADGCAVRVSTQVLQHLGGAAQRGLGIHHPFVFIELALALVPKRWGQLRVTFNLTGAPCPPCAPFTFWSNTSQAIAAPAATHLWRACRTADSAGCGTSGTASGCDHTGRTPVALHQAPQCDRQRYLARLWPGVCLRRGLPDTLRQTGASHRPRWS
jgi:hypothetical protein